MTFTVNGKEYRPEITHLSLVHSKRLIGKGFYKLWNNLVRAQAEVLKGNEDALHDAMVLGFELMLVALEVNHAGELKTVDDVAALFPDQPSYQAAAKATGEAVDRFFAVDPSLKNELDAVAEPKPKKKRAPRLKASVSRPTETSKAIDSQPTAASTSD